MATKVKFERAAAIALVLAGLVLVIPGVMAFLSNDVKLSARHNRVLAAPPAAVDLGKRPEEFFVATRAWFRDRVGFGLDAAELYHRTQYFVFADAGASSIVRNGKFVFLVSPSGASSRFSTLDRTCPSPEHWPEIGQRTEGEWDQIKTSFEGAGFKVNLLIVPSKPLLYPDRLPVSIPAEFRRNCKKSTVDDAPLVRLAQLDPSRIVFPIKEYAAVLDEPNFYPPQNYHSEGTSAYTAAEAFLTSTFPDRSRPKPEFVIEKTRADIWPIFGFERQGLISKPVFEGEDITPDPVFWGRLRAKLPVAVEASSYWNNNLPDGEKALIISDSFGVFIAPYMARGFGKLDHLSTNGFSDLDLQSLFTEIVSTESYDRVIFLFNAENVLSGRLSSFAGLDTTKPSSPDKNDDSLIAQFSNSKEDGLPLSVEFGRVLGTGWWGIDASGGGVWSMGGEKARLRIPEKLIAALGDVSLKMGRIDAVSPNPGDYSVFVCGKALEDVSRRLTESGEHFWVDLGASGDNCRGDMIVEIDSPQGLTPKELGLNDDTRHLGVLLSRIRFSGRSTDGSLQSNSYRPLEGAFAQDFSQQVLISTAFDPYFDEGWWLPAGEGVWSRSGMTSVFRMPRELFKDGAMEILASLVSGVTPTVDNLSVKICGETAEDWETAIAGEPGEPVWLKVMPNGACAEDVTIEITTERFPTPKQMGINQDERSLGVALLAIRRPS